MLNKGLRILARQNALTNSDWFDLLEERRALLAPHLRDMTLESLGDLKIVRSDTRDVRTLRMGGLAVVPHAHSDSHREPCMLKETNPHFPFDTRGIFPDDKVFYHGHFKWDYVRAPGRAEAVGHVLKFWGLTRNNQWIKIEVPIRYYTQPHNPGYDDRPEMRAWVEKVVVSESTPLEICTLCEITPQWIWQRLGNAVKMWVKHRQRLFSNVKQLAEVVRHEEAMFDIIASK